MRPIRGTLGDVTPRSRRATALPPAEPPTFGDQLVPCDSLAAPAKALLHLLLEQSRFRKRVRVVTSDLSGWALSLGLESSSVLYARDDLLEEGFLWEQDGRYVVAQGCEHDPKISKPLTRAFTISSSDPLTREAHGSIPTESVDGRNSPALCFGLEPEVSRRTAGGRGLADVQAALASEPDPAPVSRPKFRPVAEWKVPDLLDHFESKVGLVARRDRLRLAPTGLVKGLLGSHLKAWLKEGFTPTEIKAMMDLFVADYRRYHKVGADPGKVFVANRRKIFALVERDQRTTLSRDVKELTGDYVYARPPRLVKES